MEYGVDGVMLSNYGGRLFDGVQVFILVFLEVRRFYLEVFGKIQIFVDGGFECGFDILKVIVFGVMVVGVG